MPDVKRRHGRGRLGIGWLWLGAVAALFLVPATLGFAQPAPAPQPEAVPSMGQTAQALARDYGSYFPLITGLLTLVVLIRSIAISRQIANQNAALQRELHDIAAKQQRQTAQGNVLLICNERYDKMWQLFWELQHRSEPSPTEAEVYALYRRYWGLQHDQYQYFKEGLVSEEKFKYWLKARFMDYKRAHMSIATIDYKMGWQKILASEDIPDLLFYEVMNRAMDLKAECPSADAAIASAMKHYRVNLNKDAVSH